MEQNTKLLIGLSLTAFIFLGSAFTFLILEQNQKSFVNFDIHATDVMGRQTMQDLINEKTITKMIKNSSTK